MEQVIGKVIETTVMGGAFLYLLHHVTTNFNTILNKITVAIEKIAETLLRIDMRVEQLEKRINELEDK
jgi:phage-related protein